MSHFSSNSAWRPATFWPGFTSWNEPAIALSLASFSVIGTDVASLRASASSRLASAFGFAPSFFSVSWIAFQAALSSFRRNVISRSNSELSSS